MKVTEKNGVFLAEFDHFARTNLVSHCFTTRLGGVSEEEFQSLNVGYTRGDKEEAVTENLRRVLRACRMDYENMVMLRQVHGTQIHVLGEEALGGFSLTAFPNRMEGDGLLTDVPGVVLVTFHADCVPLYFLDPKRKAIGLAHAGWRGTVQNMAQEMVMKMKERYGSRPEDILAGIGPSIGKCCFQVDWPVVEQFYQAMPFSKQDIAPDKVEGKYKIDLWEINRKLLLQAGVLEDHIEVTDLCTKCRGDLFYSHRTMGERRGTMAAFLSLRC